MRLREADNIAAMAELQQQISELEIQVQISTEFTATSLQFSPSTAQHSIVYWSLHSTAAYSFFCLLASRIPIRFLHLQCDYIFMLA